jgi:type I restriction enzyme, S subunit
VRLGDVAEFIRGITFKPDDVVPLDVEDAVVCMRTKNVQTLLECDDLLAVPSQFVRRADQYLSEGDILVSSANSWNLVGKCCWVPALPWRAAFGGFISVLRGDESRVDKRYLYWWFSSGRIQTLLRSFGQKTTNISNLNIERSLQLEIPLPPLPEQRRIAAILDKADALRTQRREALAQLDRLAQAIFLEMFGDPVTNPKGWPLIEVGTVAEVQGGLQVTTARKSLPIEVPYLRVANVYRGRLDLGEVKTIRATAAEAARTKLLPRDLLVVEGHGNPDEVGRVALWGGEIADCVHQNHLIRVRFDAATVVPAFACAYLNSPGGRQHLLRAGKTTSGLNTISVSNVRAVPMALPTYAAQTVYEAQIAEVDCLKARHKTAESEAHNLFASLQHRAFRGEL